jgi:alpha-N-arabinofuranosidase
METLITSHWGVMGEVDRRRRVKLVVDEWGAWHRRGTEVNASHLFGQQSTMRDAVLAALTLDTFHRHADKVAMANVAQLVNCLHSLFLAHEDRLLATPTFHVFEMYGAHVGGQAVRAVFSAPRVSYERVNAKGSMWSLAGSASLKERTLTLTVVNAHVAEPREVEIAVRGATPARVRATRIAANDIHAHNTFERPDAVKPVDAAADAPRGALIVHTLSPASITRLVMDLA